MHARAWKGWDPISSTDLWVEGQKVAQGRAGKDRRMESDKEPTLSQRCART